MSSRREFAGGFKEGDYVRFNGIGADGDPGQVSIKATGGDTPWTEDEFTLFLPVVSFSSSFATGGWSPETFSHCTEGYVDAWIEEQGGPWEFSQFDGYFIDTKRGALQWSLTDVNP